MSQFQLTSEAFETGVRIPRQYTGDGENISPPLSWTDPPSGTKSLALVCIDPDAPRGTFTHWVVFNLPVQTRKLSAGVPREPTLSDGTVQGSNDFGQLGYAGPAPPPGKPHRYFFKLFALDTALELRAGITHSDLRAATPGHVLGEAELMGVYER
jgi:Raf kinase inhibitor-like YbhB/YbcL family protein